MDPEPKPSYQPPFPKPLTAKDKKSLWQLYKRGKKSAIHTLYEGSYRNEMSVNKVSGYKIYAPKKPADVKDILKKNYKEFPKHRIMDQLLKPLLGESIFTTNGEVWERQRRIMDIGFKKAGLKNVYQLMTEAVDDMHIRLEQAHTEGVVEIDQEMTHVTADIIMRTILSSPIESKEALKLFHYFEEFQEKSTSLNMLKTFRIPQWVSFNNYFIWKKRGKQIRKTMGAIISQRYEEFQEKEGDTNYGDILEALMGTEDPVTNTKFNTKELIDQVVMLFLAGHETSASALSWALYILANQPHYADSLATEAEQIWGGEERPSFKHLHQLKKTRDVFKETLRLYPPVPLISRESTGKCPIGERKMETNDTINVSPWIVHRHSKVWKDPHTFKPERFEEGENKNNQGAYLPFSMGPRICIGAGFALQEAILILSTVVRKYNLAPNPDHIPEPIGRLTLRSLNGVQIYLSKRNSTPAAGTEPTASSDLSTEKCPMGFGSSEPQKSY